MELIKSKEQQWVENAKKKLHDGSTESRCLMAYLDYKYRTGVFAANSVGYDAPRTRTKYWIDTYNV